MSSAASQDAMRKLHQGIAELMNKTLEEALRDGYPLDAATLGAITKFLKDNDITADPADREDLDAARKKLTEAGDPRRIAAAARAERQRQATTLIENARQSAMLQDEE